jgi:hypothetical protein
MSVTDSALDAETHLPKLIGATAHGVIDYAHAAFFFGFALICRNHNKPAARAALATGAFLLAQSFLTDYPLGIKPMISFETHGKMDVAFASASWAIPRLFGFSGTPEAKVFDLNSTVEGVVFGMTDFSSAHVRAEGSRD